MTAALMGALLTMHPGTPADDLPDVRPSRRVEALRIAEPIHVDGRLDEPAWERAEPATDFVQQEPDERAPATRRSEVRFLYDATTLYVGAMLHDEAPAQAIVNDLKRDFSGADGDMFGVILDTFLDATNAYGFITNPGGAARDTQAYDNGRRNDPSWNAVWQVRTALHPHGWSVEMALPFASLRFPEGPDQEWGLNLIRIVRRDNERSTWAPVPRQFSHYNVAYAGRLAGIRGVERGRSLQVKPFLTGGVTAGDPRGTQRSTDGGLDLKWGLTPSLTLDATYRTDFSQVEADEQQVNLTRFSLFFPEKRDFFLESPAIFQIGLAEAENQDPRRDLLPFFSRRIGLSADGLPIPVVGGTRLTGRAGPHGIGLLAMQTEAFDGRAPDTFVAGRFTRNLSATTTAGAFYFGREARGLDAFNRVVGADVRYAPRATVQMSAFAMRSTTADAQGDWAGRIMVRLDGPAHRARIGLIHVGSGFRHDLGFVRRAAVATSHGAYTRVLRPKPGSRVREHTLGAEAEITTDDRYRDTVTRIATLSYGVLFADGAELRAWGRSTAEDLQVPFRVGPLHVPAGRHGYHEAGVTYRSNRSAAVSGHVEATAGEFWSGRREALTAGLRVRFSGRFAVSGTAGRSAVTLQDGTFAPVLAGVRLDYSFSPRMFLNAFVQHNSGGDAWLSNVRFNLVHRPLSDIYVVWDEGRLAGVPRRAVAIKYTHLLSF